MPLGRQIRTVEGVYLVGLVRVLDHTIAGPLRGPAPGHRGTVATVYAGRHGRAVAHGLFGLFGQLTPPELEVLNSGYPLADRFGRVVAERLDHPHNDRGGRVHKVALLHNAGGVVDQLQVKGGVDFPVSELVVPYVEGIGRRDPQSGVQGAPVILVDMRHKDPLLDKQLLASGVLDLVIDPEHVVVIRLGALDHFLVDHDPVRGDLSEPGVGHYAGAFMAGLE